MTTLYTVCTIIRKMSQNRKLKKLSSSSSEEDEKLAKKQKKSVSSTVKDDSQSYRQIKQPVYRMATTEATEQKSANQEKQWTKTKKFSMPFLRGNYSSKEKNCISGKDKSVSGSKTVERGPSKPLNTNNAVPHRTKRSKSGSDNSSSQSYPSKSKKQRLSPYVASAEQEEQKQDLQRRKWTAEDLLRAVNGSSTIKTREPTSSFSKDSLQQKRRELVKMKCQRHKEKKTQVKKSSCKDSKGSSTSTIKKSSTSAKHTASEGSSKMFKNVTSAQLSVISVSHKTAQSPSTQKQIHSLKSSVPLKFKIPKKVQSRPEDSEAERNDAISSHTNLKHRIKLSDAEQKTVPPARSCLDVTPDFPRDVQEKRSSFFGQFPATDDTNTESWYDQMQMVEELHLARSEKRLEVNVMQSYGELTCMDIDSPDEGPADTNCRQPRQQDLILVLDTNILLSNLDYVKRIRSEGLGALGFPVVLIPWVVLQELDYLKKKNNWSGSVSHLAIPAISYIHNTLKRREPHLWGQSMQQATESSEGLNAETNDDRVLQCCLQYQRLYPECALILCTNDKNLCCKAILSGVKALCKNDLEAEVQRCRPELNFLQSMQTPVLPHIHPQVSSPMPSGSSATVQPHRQEKAGLSVGLVEKDSTQLSPGDQKTKWDLSRCVCGLEQCLREVLSDVLEVEMKAIYQDLWLEIVYRKPPWTLRDVLHCLKKHWIAVFGQIVPRRKQQTVLNLINFFNSGETADRNAASEALQEAKELVKAFWKSSEHVPHAISVMDNIFNELQPQPHLPVEGEPSSGDVVMNDDDDDDEDKQPSTAQVSHHEVWAVFESIWSNVNQISWEVFKALGFDPHTMQSAQPAGGPPPPQDVLACLHKLSSTVSQLLQAFNSVLSSAPGLDEARTLLSIIHSNKIVNEDSRLQPKDILDCFSQPDYREKLGVGGSQLMQLQELLGRCARAAGQHHSR
ncbi:transcriptional protein SWT1 isoform X1 [Brachyistius frenatus]|uniref:transcriptional protein SWT1 isoform X1 n=2 Tax=Brachyistius frenatus TaxID=100188 RepID=UPI0037E8ECA1